MKLKRKIFFPLVFFIISYLWILTWYLFLPVKKIYNYPPIFFGVKKSENETRKSDSYKYLWMQKGNYFIPYDLITKTYNDDKQTSFSGIVFYTKDLFEDQISEYNKNIQKNNKGDIKFHKLALFQIENSPESRNIILTEFYSFFWGKIFKIISISEIKDNEIISLLPPEYVTFKWREINIDEDSESEILIKASSGLNVYDFVNDKYVQKSEYKSKIIFIIFYEAFLTLLHIPGVFYIYFIGLILTLIKIRNKMISLICKLFGILILIYSLVTIIMIWSFYYISILPLLLLSVIIFLLLRLK